ncbi:MAG TPA: peptide-N-glycosidase F-related protein [Chitinophagaceae bacterium]|nr:peptide-N-glycosidase F-related protein [Chitinophagaceae bacterium]
MKRAFILLYLLCQAAWVLASDTLHVVTHQREFVVTDPAQGVRAYPRWGVFPSAGVPIRKILLHVRFACPDSVRCADWDYLDAIRIRRTGGVNGPSRDFEIGRMLTPYGGAFGKDWHFTWDLDITDFSLLLRDSVEIVYNHSGFEPNQDRGWLVTLDFELIRGTPVAEPIRIEKIYDGNFRYGVPGQSIETALAPVGISRARGASFGKLKIYQTGHGDNPRDGCGEFCSKMRDIVYDGKRIDRRPVWKSCADNALFPQAGTWLLDRANWCPGYLQIPDEYLLPLHGRDTVDVNMEPYEYPNSQAVENITAYFIQYSRRVTRYDASIEDILVPSSRDIYSRVNPSCLPARVIIRNNGSRDLRFLDIGYGTLNGPTNHYAWKGRLAPGRHIEVTLPGPLPESRGDTIFLVSLTRPNHRPDEFPLDNRMEAHFQPPPVHPGSLVLVFQTNNQPQQNTWHLVNESGSTLYHRQFDSTQKNQLFRDTLHLQPGGYTLVIDDTARDGLEFWFNTRGGRGSVRLEDSTGNLVQAFESDFGSALTYAFRVSRDSSQWSPMNREPAVGLFPTLTTGRTVLDYYGGREKDVTVQILTDEGGRLIEAHHYYGLKAGSFTYDLSYRPAQRYYLKVFVDGQLRFTKRIRVVEKVNF